MSQLIESAAIYCPTESPGAISVEWLRGIIDFFSALGLPVRAYHASGHLDCPPQVVLDNDSENRLLQLVQTGELRSVEMHCHSRKQRELIFDWEATATIDLEEGYTHV